MENKEKSWDHLKKLTKDQIIQFLKEKFFLTAPDKNDILFFMWDAESEKLNKLMRDHVENHPDLGIRSSLAKRFNSSTDEDERMGLIKRIVACDKEWEKRNEHWEDLTARQKKNNKLYELIDR